MKIVVDIPENLLERVREAIDKGEYDDPQEFVKVSVENQLQLENTSGEGDEMMSLSTALEKEIGQSNSDGVESSFGNDSDGVNGLQKMDSLDIPTVENPKPNRREDGPLWGQYNRIFPVKLVVRALANSISQSEVQVRSNTEEEWIPREQFADYVSQQARELGLNLQRIDSEKSRGKGEKLSTALPTGSDPENSLKRFKAHFVGYLEQDGTLLGATPNLLFSNTPEDSPNLIGITESGVEFAKLTNPILDHNIESDTSLSEKERTFYLNHVSENLPSEYEAMEFTLESIKEGHNRPDSLTSRVATLNDDWTDAQASTVRSGLISRMVELQIVTRTRVGQRGVAYEIEEEAADQMEVSN